MSKQVADAPAAATPADDPGRGRSRLGRDLVAGLVVLGLGAAIGLGLGRVVTPGSDAQTVAQVDPGPAVTQAPTTPADPATEAPPTAAPPAPVPPSEVLVLSGGTLDDQEALLAGLGGQGELVVDPTSGWTYGPAPLGRAVLDFLPDSTLDLVVLQGGEGEENDSVEVAALHGIDRIRAGSSAATSIVLVGPVPEAGDDPDDTLAVRTALRNAAGARDLPYLDPVELGWTQEQPDLDAAVAAALAPLLPAG